MHFYYLLFGRILRFMYFCIVLLKNTGNKKCNKSAYAKVFVQIYKIKRYKTKVWQEKNA